MVVRKAFSRNLYNKSDKTAKNILKTYLSRSGHSLLNDEENYHADLETRKNGKRYFHEAEIKYAWNGEWPLQWNEIRIPFRKQRLLDKYQDHNLTFYVISGDQERFWKIPATVLKTCEIREASNKYIDKGEKFFHIPTSKALLVMMNPVEEDL
jgi:hypothetical protein